MAKKTFSEILSELREHRNEKAYQLLESITPLEPNGCENWRKDYTAAKLAHSYAVGLLEKPREVRVAFVNLMTEEFEKEMIEK